MLLFHEARVNNTYLCFVFPCGTHLSSSGHAALALPQLERAFSPVANILLIFAPTASVAASAAAAAAAAAAFSLHAKSILTLLPSPPLTFPFIYLAVIVQSDRAPLDRNRTVHLAVVLIFGA